MTDHFIKNIAIKDFKCFDDFKADGFERVNLIGGKNNVGKTAFMEACLLVNGSFNSLPDAKPFVKEKLYIEIIKLLLTIEQNRKGSDFMLQWVLDTYELNQGDFNIELPKKFNLYCYNNIVSPDEFQKRNYWNHGSFKLSEHRENEFFYEVRKNKGMPSIQDYFFVTPCNNTFETIKKLMGKVKKANKSDYINSQLKALFNIEKIDLTDDDVIVFDDSYATYKSLSEYGDGVKHFLNIVLTLLTNANSVIYLDEVENGMHHKNLDMLWEVIFTISKEQNTQVFSTTHSKECIKSFNRVQLKLNDKKSSYFELAKEKSTNKIFMSALPPSQLEYELSHQGKFRGE